MPSHVAPLHFVTIEYRLDEPDKVTESMETSGQHRFLYGVESWIEGVDQQLEGLQVGEHLELFLEHASAAHVVSRLAPPDRATTSLALQVRIMDVVKAEPREVVKALAATVHCCDHCGDH